MTAFQQSIPIINYIRRTMSKQIQPFTSAKVQTTTDKNKKQKTHNNNGYIKKARLID